MKLLTHKDLEKKLDPQTQKMLKGKTLKERLEIVEASKAEGPIEGEGQVVTETKQLMMLKQAISFIDYSVGD